MSITVRIARLLRLQEATPIPTALIAGTGAGLILAAAQFEPADDKTLLRLIWYVALAAGVVLLVYGVLMLMSMFVRSGQFVRAFGSRLRFQMPVYVAPDRELRSSDEAHMSEDGHVAIHEETDRVSNDRDRLRNAVDTTITWLYRRQNWGGLSAEARSTEPAPASIWANQKYAELGIDNLSYEPPTRVPGEPGWDPPRDETQVVPADEPSGLERVAEALVEMSKRPLPPPDTRRPPKARDLPENAWRVSRPEFCKLIRGLIMGGEALTAQLHGIVANASPLEEGKWDPRVDRWIIGVNRLVETYYDSASFPAGERALAPAWRQKMVMEVTSRLRWLREQLEWFGCDH